MVATAFSTHLIFCLALPDVLLRIFDPVYSASRIPLIILLCGQFFWVFCAMSMRLIPMSGRSMLTLINGIIAVVLNVICNIIFIPQYGAIGAAIATVITLNLWAGWRLIEIWHIMRCHPFSKGNVLFFVLCVGVSTLLFQFTYDIGKHRFERRYRSHYWFIYTNRWFLVWKNK